MFPLMHLWGNEELWDSLSSRDMSHAPGENIMTKLSEEDIEHMKKYNPVGVEFDEHGIMVYPRNEPCDPNNIVKGPKLLTCKNKEDGTRELEKKDDKIITVEVLKEQLVNAKEQVNATR